MNALEIIAAIQAGRELSEGQIHELIQAYTQDRIPDYQMAAFLMAVYFQGLNSRETKDLTRAMIASGQLLDFSAIPGRKVDKHSTGGVGDKVSLIVAPLVATLGVPVPMMAGRGLGHTGGTIDKLESIPGFRTQLTQQQIYKQMQEIGVAIFSQSEEIAPADGKIYALRDVTSTVRSIPLIVASILSKKIAEGIEALLMDVKFGNGAFFSDLQAATDLARSLIEVGTELGLQVEALLTDMDQPLGYTIGNWLEVREALAILHGDTKATDLLDLCLTEAAYLLVLGQKTEDLHHARSLAEEALKSGRALEKFRELAQAQGADLTYIDHLDRYPEAKHQRVIEASQDGYIESINALVLGQAAVQLGAGRQRKGDLLDHQAGLVLHQKRGDRVHQGAPLVTLFHNRPDLPAAVLASAESAFRIAVFPPPARPLIWKHLSARGETDLV